ncbi:heart- and neural crest derivatives-expressed protein 2 [Parasteatoda tepidariorum]|uniref:heart- and neural crest derivatives-expressed protein 2 n=1 Tax=Parasteatoda tepidariorum TaxID=114398 RepID=UPI00077FBA37|nr:heart- and neural crest derivatives-expressed protein 2 [Parasteatoda tepidariorum]
MSLVGNYQQLFRSSDTTAYPQHYYGNRYDIASASQQSPSDSSYLGWSFSNYSPDTSIEFISPIQNKEFCVGSELRPERGYKKRVTANRKERRRTLSINNAFAELRECIPHVPQDTKLSKIKILKLATSYIAYLMDLLAQEDPHSGPHGGFKAELCKKYESREERRKREIANLEPGQNKDRKSKGRTGWPQHVWALELKSD